MTEKVYIIARTFIDTEVVQQKGDCSIEEEGMSTDIKIDWNNFEHSAIVSKDTSACVRRMKTELKMEMKVPHLYSTKRYGSPRVPDLHRAIVVS